MVRPKLEIAEEISKASRILQRSAFSKSEITGENKLLRSSSKIGLEEENKTLKWLTNSSPISFLLFKKVPLSNFREEIELYLRLIAVEA